MATKVATAARLRGRDEGLEDWSSEHSVSIARLDDGQRWVVFAAMQAAAVLGDAKPLLRLLAFVLSHSGMGIPGQVVGALTSVTDRAVRDTKNLSVPELLHSVKTPPRGRGKPKLGAEYAGSLAKFLVNNPKAQSKDIVRHIHSTLGIELDRKTLRVYLNRHGLGCLRGESIDERPLF